MHICDKFIMIASHSIPTLRNRDFSVANEQTTLINVAKDTGEYCLYILAHDWYPHS